MNARAHERAVRSLESGLSLTHPHELDVLIDYRRRLVAALVELGVLDADEQQEWASRFERVRRPPATPDEELQARALALLERDLSDAAQLEAVNGTLSPRERFTTNLQALLETGIVPWPERARLIERIDAVSPDTSERIPQPTYHLGQLRQVVAGPDTRLGGLRVTSVELYDDCSIVRWHLLADPEPGWRERISVTDRAQDLATAHAPTSLNDDLGSAYALEPMTFLTMPDTLRLRHTPETLAGATAFTPAVPKRAARLTIHTVRGQLPIHLPEPR